MTIKIRKVTLADVKSLIPLIAQLGYPISEEHLMARVALYQLGQNDIAWAAVDGDNIVGCIAVHIYDLFHCTERYGRIVSIVVDEQSRRKGIGKRLILHAEKYLKEKNCHTLELSTSLKRKKFGAPEFCAALGYQNEGEYESYYLRKFFKPKEGPVI
jgi:ribosomal protein S18 acetylase RimI-like enzyme